MPEMIRASGEEIEAGAPMWCTSQYCENCAKFYQQRVYACAAAVMCECKEECITSDECTCSRPYLTTLTVALPPGTERKDLDRNLHLVRRIRSNMLETLRRTDDAWEKFIQWSATGDLGKIAHWKRELKRRLPKPPVSRANFSKYCSSWSDEFGFPPASKIDERGKARTTYIWAIEVTSGQFDDRWHVHLHVLTPTRSDAERVNAAWQLHREQTRVANTDISGGPSSSYRVRADEKAPPLEQSDPVAYVVAYVSKAGLDKLPESMRLDYVEGMQDVRKYDAGGAWRPLGIGKKPSDDPVVWLIDSYGRGVEPTEYLAGRATDYAVSGLAHAIIDTDEARPLEMRLGYARELSNTVSQAPDDIYDVERCVCAAFLAQYRTSLRSASATRARTLETVPMPPCPESLPDLSSSRAPPPPD